MADNSIPRGVRLNEPTPKGRNAIPDGLFWAGSLLLAVFVCIVAWGMHKHHNQKLAQTDARTQDMQLSSSGKSNRESVEKAHGEEDKKKSVATPPGTHPSIGFTPQTQPMMPSGQDAALKAWNDLQDKLTKFEEERRDAPMSQKELDSPARGGHIARSSALPTIPKTTMGAGALNSLLAAAQQPQPTSLYSGNGAASADETSYDIQNAQSQKEAFQKPENKQNDPSDDYLKATRVPSLSEFEIKQGRRIPAELDEAINSDLPGEISAIIRKDENDEMCGVVRKDGSTHCYVEIPHGTRAVGTYNSRITYGQNRVQVIWHRLIFPDMSSLDLDKMAAHATDGASGLHDQVDNHWKRIIGGVVMSSILSAGLQISQEREYNGYNGYPSTTSVLGAAVGQEASRAGAVITQRNMNLQPTVKIRPGEHFVIVVNKDIVFDGPYKPMR